MWSRRDWVVLASAAVGAFGLTVGTFWPRVANAVDLLAAVTTEVKVPTLDLGAAVVSATLDIPLERTVVLTVKNTTDKAATAEFKAVAQVTDPVSPFSRSRGGSRNVWSNEYSVDLKPGETKTVSVELPAAAFGPTESPADTNGKAVLRMGGASYLQLAGKDKSKAVQSINALTLWTQPAPAMPQNVQVSVADEMGLTR